MELKLNSGQLVTDKRPDDGGVPPDVLASVLVQLTGGGRFIKVGVDVGREVGGNNCVEIGSSRFVRARRPGKDWQSIFVIGRESVATTLVTVLLVQQGGGYNLIETYFGEPRPAEPGNDDQLRLEPSGFAKAREEATGFWRTHGLVLGSCDVRCTTRSCGALIHQRDVLACFDKKSEILCAACRAAETAGDEW